jgi:DNA-binding GntR family transcriptional regulator
MAKTKDSPVAWADRIAERLQTEIVSGKYAPGARLIEREIAERFGVSSIPAREALQILEARGLARKRLNRGYTVIDPSPAEMLRMCELRDLVELEVVEWAACRAKPEGLQRLAAKLKTLQKAAEAGSLPRFFEADLEFHRVMWELSGNAFAARALEAVVGSLFACGLRNAQVNLREQYALHERLFETIRKGQPHEARLLLKDIATGFREELFR